MTAGMSTDKHSAAPQKLPFMKEVSMVENEQEISWDVRSEAEDMAVALSYISKRMACSRKLVTLKISPLSCKHCPFLTANSSSVLTSLTALDVSCSPIGDRGLQTLGVSCMPNLKSLQLQQTELGDSGVRFLLQNSSLLSGLTSLNLRANTISPELLLSFSQSLEASWDNLLELNDVCLHDDGERRWEIIAMEQSQLLVAFAGMRANKVAEPVAVKLKLKGTVDCSFLTSLHALDLSSNNLRDLQLLSSLHSLRGLNLSDNSITDNKSLSLITLRCLTSLTELNLAKNHIGPAGCRLLGETLPFLPQLLQLDLSHNDMECDGLASLVAGFSCISNLQSLSLSSNSLHCDAAFMLASQLSMLSSLAVLDLSDNEMRADGCGAIARGIARLRGLQVLGLRGNSIGSEGAALLSECMAGATSLTSLDLAGNSIDPSWRPQSVSLLSKLVNLRALSLGQNHLRQHLMSPLCRALSQLSDLSELSLSSNGITSQGIKQVLEYGCTATSLTSLDIGGNGMAESCDGAGIADALRLMGWLTRLDLSSLCQEERQVSAILAAVFELSNLTELNVSGVCLSSWKPPAPMLLTNLTSLRCRQVNLPRTSIDSLVESIRALPRLISLDVSRNQLQLSGAVLLGESVAAVGSSLSILDVSHNDLRDKGTIALCEGLRQCARLERLTLDGNEIGRDAVEQLLSSAHCWRQLRLLSLRDNPISSLLLATILESLPEHVRVVE